VICPPSLTNSYDLVYSGDPALDTPPEPTRNEGESDADWEARAVAFYKGDEWVTWQNRLRIARETGKPEAWQSLLKPGSVPTLFHMRQVPGTTWRKVYSHLESAKPGAAEIYALAFRAAIMGFTHFDHKVKRATDRNIGEDVATVDVVNALDAVHPSIVTELGGLVFERMSSPRPLS
jgi:hypothetical protein